MFGETPKELRIDVSELEAPQPFEEVHQLLLNMQAGEYIYMVHRKKPLPLIQLLLENGFKCEVQQIQQTDWHIIIWNPEDSWVDHYCSAQFKS